MSRHRQTGWSWSKWEDTLVCLAGLGEAGREGRVSRWLFFYADHWYWLFCSQTASGLGRSGPFFLPASCSRPILHSPLSSLALCVRACVCVWVPLSVAFPHPHSLLCSYHLVLPSCCQVSHTPITLSFCVLVSLPPSVFSYILPSPPPPPPPPPPLFLPLSVRPPPPPYLAYQLLMDSAQTGQSHLDNWWGCMFAGVRLWCKACHVWWVSSVRTYTKGNWHHGLGQKPEHRILSTFHNFTVLSLVCESVRVCLRVCVCVTAFSELDELHHAQGVCSCGLETGEDRTGRRGGEV